MRRIFDIVIGVTFIIAGLYLLSGCNGYYPSTGATGRPGLIGSPGSNGFNAAFSQGVADSSLCSSGGVVLNAGVDLNSNGVLDTSEVTQTLVTCNGLNGTNGVSPTPSSFTPTSILNPCGDAPGIYDEVFLKMANGTVLASFSDNANGNNTRFSILVPGNYQTTDGDNCTFTLDVNGNITNENHHY